LKYKCDNILLSQVFIYEKKIGSYMAQINEKIITDLQSEQYEPPSAIRMDRTMYDRKMYVSCINGSGNSYWCHYGYDGGW